MKHDGTDLFTTVIEGDWPGFTKTVKGSTTVLDNGQGDVIQARATAKGRYMIQNVGRGEPPISFGQQLGNGNLRTNLKTKLARWGIETRPERQQQNAKQERLEEEEEIRAADAADNTEETDNTPDEEDVTTQAIDEILDDVPGSIELLTAYILELAKKNPQARRHEDRGVVCYDWPGDLYSAMRDLWKGLPEEADPADLKQLYIRLFPTMRRSGVLRQIKEGAQTIWRVRDPDAKPATAETPTPASTAATPHVPAPSPAADNDRVPPEQESATPVAVVPEEPAEVKIHKCPDCAFADPVQHAVQAHINKFAARPDDHPRDVEPLPCPEGCGSVRMDVPALRKHCVEAHPEKYADKILCQKRTCLTWWDTMQAFRAHLPIEHADEVSKRKVVDTTPTTSDDDGMSTPQRVSGGRKTGTPPAVPVTPVRAVPVPVQAAVNGSALTEPVSMEAAANAAVQMIQEYPALKAEVESLRTRNQELEEEMRTLKKKQASLAKRLSGLKSLLTDD